MSRAEDTRCALCSEVVAREDQMGFTHLGSDNPLIQQVEDSTVHASCFAEWDGREQFVAAWNKAVPDNMSDHRITTKDGAASGGVLKRLAEWAASFGI